MAGLRPNPTELDHGVAGYGILFAAAFGAATLLPLQSEAFLVALLWEGYPAVCLVAVAATGNVLGSIVNWILGRQFERLRERRWFPKEGAALTRARRWYERYGRWTLLLSWLPVVGDPLTLVAGGMRERLSVFIALVTLAKAGRYALLAIVAGPAG